ncbi:hypothetical protein B296_00018611 [Ensete ventricosum]|uniref:Uncharacterized protein n=1 Tax=Ensete ventricosum TaxID=4639 RepID=A0A426ZNC4_ENSVE|nr:hypothetical protein B296_00018611 [Ensete ventricosum]
MGRTASLGQIPFVHVVASSISATNHASGPRDSPLSSTHAMSSRSIGGYAISHSLSGCGLSTAESNGDRRQLVAHEDKSRPSGPRHNSLICAICGFWIMGPAAANQQREAPAVLGRSVRTRDSGDKRRYGAVAT